MTTHHPSEWLLTGLDIQHRDHLVGFFLPSSVSSLEKGQGASLGTVLFPPVPCPTAASGSTASSGLVHTCTAPPPRHSHSINPALVAAQTVPEVTSCGFTGHLRAFWLLCGIS